ncbi:MAG: hypothetical protein ABW076_07835 [Candidatus Thiodiazotropha sp.]
MKFSHLTAAVFSLLLLFSTQSQAFDVGGFVNGVIEGVSDSFKDAKGKPGAHEKNSDSAESESGDSAGQASSSSDSEKSKD